MNIEIINKPFTLNLHGFSGAATNRDYVNTAFKLSDKMWQTVKGNSLKNKGLNVWVYEPHEMVFTGVELDEIPAPGIGLETDLPYIEIYGHWTNEETKLETELLMCLK